jgi:hypothetical protein
MLSTCRQCERKWRHTRLETDRKKYKEQREKVNTMIDTARSNYYEAKVAECKDQKSLFKLIDNLLHRKGKKVLPHYDSLEELTEKFSDYFYNKIAQIRTVLDSEPSPSLTSTDDSHASCKFTSFSPLTIDDVKKQIREMPKKSCPLDPLPTWLLTECLDEIAPVITQIINLSLTSGEVPASLKFALIGPLIKKLLLDADILKNYRPVSNLPFLGKVTEKAATKQIQSHTDEHGLEEKFQSAYKALHSTETALLRVHNDILCHIDAGKGVILVLLDLSAAFDTIDHTILVDRLSQTIGIEGSAKDWFKSYLSDRHQAVNIDGITSKPKDLPYGVPQGSIIGPKSFTCYTTPISEICRRHGVEVHLYADDTQLYICFDPKNPASQDQAMKTIEKCIEEIKLWMQANNLKLNDEKTELLVISSPGMAKKVHLSQAEIGKSKISSSPKCRNLGVIFDRFMNMEEQVKQICKAVNFHLRNIHSIRRVLSQYATEKLVHALVTSRLDNCNALLYGIPQAEIHKLQALQNSAARLVTSTKKI